MAESIVIIGSGNVSFHLAHAFFMAGIPVRQVYNRSQRGLSHLATMTRIPVTSNLNQLITDADIYLIAVTDDAIQHLSLKLAEIIMPEALIVHTSGSCSMEVFSSAFKHYGAFYPLQSFKKERKIDFKEVPIFISGNKDVVITRLTALAAHISDRVIPISDKDRAKLHIPAVLVNNFVNHLYSIAFDLCQREGIQFEHLFPLMKETINRLSDGTDPSELQTGPAIRKDNNTLDNHRKKLGEHPEILDLYNYLTSHIIKYYEDR